MASEAGLYSCLWEPETLGYDRAGMLVDGLHKGLLELHQNPKHFQAMNPSNGWGSYEGLVKFVTNYLKACEENPDAKITVSR